MPSLNNGKARLDGKLSWSVSPPWQPAIGGFANLILHRNHHPWGWTKTTKFRTRWHNDTDWCAVNNVILLPPPNCQKVHDSNDWTQIIIQNIQSHPTKTVRQQPTTWSVMMLTRVISYGQQRTKGEMWSLVGSIWWALPPSSPTWNSKPKGYCYRYCI